MGIVHIPHGVVAHKGRAPEQLLPLPAGQLPRRKQRVHHSWGDAVKETQPQQSRLLPLLAPHPEQAIEQLVHLAHLAVRRQRQRHRRRPTAGAPDDLLRLLPRQRHPALPRKPADVLLGQQQILLPQEAHAPLLRLEHRAQPPQILGDKNKVQPVLGALG